MKVDEAALTQERKEAWIGDAVLALYARQWLLREKDTLDGEAFIRFTSNEFLKPFGKSATAVEAEIGRIYEENRIAKWEERGRSDRHGNKPLSRNLRSTPRLGRRMLS